MIELLLVLNALWFALGFHVFAMRHRIFAKLLVPREHRNTPVFDMLAESGRFLGGFNLAFAMLSLLLLLNVDVFGHDLQWAILLFVIATAHGTQFAFNVPIALDNRQGEGVWYVLSGMMLFIFITDFVMMILNIIMAMAFFL